MPSVSEQLQKYRSLKVATARVAVPETPCMIEWQHPKTTDYFRKLMQQWQTDSDGSEFSAAQD